MAKLKALVTAEVIKPILEALSDRIDFEYAGYNINHDVMPREELKERVRDIDILVSFDKDAKVSLFQYAHIICQLEELLQRKVDLVEEGTLLPFAQQTANHDKILIYERGS